MAVIGLGCIGGSLARALAAQGIEVRTWSTSPTDRQQAAAARLHVVDGDTDGIARACVGATIVVLAVPLDAMAEVARMADAAAGRDAILVHVGGLQRPEALGLDDALHGRVLGTHPLAGSHESGFAASRADLFIGCTVSIEARAGARERQQAEWLWRASGAHRIDYRTAEAHDRLMTWVSHLPQLTATALAATLAAGGIDPDDTGPGARDTTRLAASALGSWPTILRGAPPELDEALAQLEHHVAELRRALAAGDVERLRAIWEAGRAWRRQVSGGHGIIERGERRA